MKVRDAMARAISCAAPGDRLRDVAAIMRAEGAGFVPVVEGGLLVGVLTDRDIVIRCIAEGSADPVEGTIGQVMSTDVQTVAPQDDLAEAARLMSEAEVRRLPVVEGGRLVGVLSHGNLVQATGEDGAGAQATLGITRGA